MTQEDKNQAFIKQFKKDNNVKVQTTLPTALDRFQTQVISDGCTATDGAWWRKYCDDFKMNFRGQRMAMHTLLELCFRCSCEPWQLIKLGRQNYGFTKFTDREILVLRDNLLDDGEPCEGEQEDGSYEETSEPYNSNPNSEEAYEIDDDVAVSSTGKRRLKRRGRDEDDDEAH